MYIYNLYIQLTQLYWTLSQILCLILPLLYEITVQHIQFNFSLLCPPLACLQGIMKHGMFI